MNRITTPVAPATRSHAPRWLTWLARRPHGADGQRDPAATESADWSDSWWDSSHALQAGTEVRIRALSHSEWEQLVHPASPA